MSAELARVRTKFVDGVSSAVIDDLLDDLLEDRILSDAEKDSILQENNSTRNKARQLIDTVKKKGDDASWKMIAHLLNRDPTLHKNLALSSGQPAHSVADSQVVQGWSTTLIPTSQAFWREKQSDKSTYRVTKTSIASRVALLITNIKFADERLNRAGAEMDEQNMKNLLGANGYEVVQYSNLTGEQIKEALVKFSKHPKLKETDSVFVVIMSHGKMGAVLGVNWNENPISDEKPDIFPVSDIYKYLNTVNCPLMEDKPKIIIIQACRGDEKGSVLVSDGAENTVCDNTQQPSSSASPDYAEDALRFAPKEKDFISLLSCTPDQVSYRHTERGSVLIQYFVDVLNTYGWRDDIEELFRKVMQRFEEEFTFQHRRQIPSKDRCTMIRRFYLFPGLQDQIQ